MGVKSASTPSVPAGLPPSAVQKQVLRGFAQATASTVVAARRALYSGS